jgi:hypothetical protein
MPDAISLPSARRFIASTCFREATVPHLSIPQREWRGSQAEQISSWKRTKSHCSRIINRLAKMPMFFIDWETASLL